MGWERDSLYYDNCFSSLELYKKNYQESNYYVLWRRILELLLPLDDKKILELGCGTGQFAHMLYDNKLKHYVGIDFSLVAIQQCQRYMLTEFQFICNNVFSINYQDIDYDCIVACEFLEHINDDIPLLKMIKGKDIIMTLPTFDDPGHVRFFLNVDEITKRYAELILVEFIERFNEFFILKGVVKDV